MTLDRKRKKVVVIDRKHPVERAVAEAVAHEGADVVIWLRKWNNDGNEAKVLPIAQLEIPSQRPNGASPNTSLWRQSMGKHKSYCNSGNATPAFTGRLSLKVLGIKCGGIGKKGCEANRDTGLLLQREPKTQMHTSINQMLYPDRQAFFEKFALSLPPQPAIKIGPAPMPGVEHKQGLRTLRKAVPAQRLSTAQRSMGFGR